MKGPRAATYLTRTSRIRTDRTQTSGTSIRTRIIGNLGQIPRETTTDGTARTGTNTADGNPRRAEPTERRPMQMAVALVLPAPHARAAPTHRDRAQQTAIPTAYGCSLPSTSIA